MRRAAGLLLVLLLAAAACGGKARSDGAPASAAADSAPELALLDRFERLDDEVEKSRGQCPRLARGIHAWLDGHDHEVERLIETSRAHPGLDDARLGEVEQHLERIFDRVIDAVATCKGQGGVDDAYARLDAWLEAT